MTNSIRRNRRLVFVVAVVLLVSFIQPPPAVALPEKSVFDYYYSGCGTLTYLGEEGVDCGGVHYDTYDDNTPFKWRWHYEERCNNNNCGDFCDTTSYFLEVCQNGSAKIVSETDFWNANCSC